MEEQKRQFEHMYDTYVDAIFRYFSWRMSSRERARELTHDVFMRVWQHIADNKPIMHENAFIYTIAKRLFINEIRNPAHIASLEMLQDTASFDAPDMTQVDAETAATITDIWKALETFPFAVQEIMRLRYRDGLSVRDIAALLELKETAVSMRISRTIQALQERFHSIET